MSMFGITATSTSSPPILTPTIIGITVVAGTISAILWYFWITKDIKSDKSTTEKIKEICQLIDNAEKEVYIQSDGYFDELLGCLRRAAERGVEIKVVLDPEGKEPEGLRKFAKVEHTERGFKELSLLHYMVIDEKSVRVEEFHEPGKFAESDAEGIVWENYPWLAQHVKNEIKETLNNYV